MNSTKWTLPVLAACALALNACTTIEEDDTAAEPFVGDELPVGDIEGLQEIKADGWGYATVCKPIPYLEPLTDPAITISLDGLTLRLYDRAGDYDRTFPVGVGQIEDAESLTPDSLYRSDGVFYTRTDLAPTIDGNTPSTARWGWNYSCRMWWTDEQGNQIPVFAGLPFIRLQGPSSTGYGIHGPVDQFNRSNGGNLRRGYVSHGCVRMEAADLVEVYALIQGHSAPVRIQQAIERRPDDRAVDTPDSWLLRECRADQDCAEGLHCEPNPYSGRGFCTQYCDAYCPDRSGAPTTFCVDNPNGGQRGICMYRALDFNNHCRSYDHSVEVAAVPRFSQPWIKRNTCLPGTEGWIGDRCLSDRECLTGVCSAVDGGPEGICSEPCSRYCPDKAGGYAVTFCIDDPDTPVNGMCTARCDNNDDCAMGTTCESAPRHSQASMVRNACVPY